MFVENKRVYELKIIVIYDRIKKRGVCMDDFQFEYDQKKKTRLAGIGKLLKKGE